MTTSGPLAGWSVLVTRPAHQAETLCRLLEGYGAESVRFPLIGIEPVDDPATTALALAALEAGAWAVFTSVNAVQEAMARGLRAHHLHPGRVAAIGPATAAALRTIGVEPMTPPPPHTTEALLSLPGFTPSGPVVLVKGVGGRAALANALTARGGQVMAWPVYRRTAGSGDGRQLSNWLRMPASKAVIITSGEALERLFVIVAPTDRDALNRTPMVVVSARLDDHARRLGPVRTVLCAAGAADSLIVDTLLHRVTHAMSSFGEPK